MKKIYMAGVGGMLGEAFYKIFNQSYDLMCTDIDINEEWLTYLDFRNYEKYLDSVCNYEPNWLFHIGAYTDLEYCELHEEDTYITNLESIYNELVNKNPDIYVILKNNLRFVDTFFFGGSKKFFLDYVLPFSEKINDTKGIYIEHCVAKAVLNGINDNLRFKYQSVYPFAEGYIGTNNKKIKNNIFKKIKMNLLGKLKNYLINHKKY